MDQKFEGSPKADIRLEGRRVVRGEVSQDWGSRLQWQIKRDGKIIATPLARGENSYEHPDEMPGRYEIVLQMWKYVDYKKNRQGEFTNSSYVDISETVSYTI